MQRIKVGITIGDPSGIGPEVTLKAIKNFRGTADFTVIGDSFVLGKLGFKKNAKLFKLIDLNNIIKSKFVPGKVSCQSGKASIEYLDCALSLLKSNKIDCLVTAPVSKEAINLAGIKFIGHTEYLKEMSKSKFVSMMLLNDKMKFILGTRHIPLKDVASSLKKDEICNNLLLANASLKLFFNINKPKFIVCGLNPHASDNGLIGKEEKAIIMPAINQLTKRMNVYGPMPSDVAIYKLNHGLYDCALCMYHDQALIALKLEKQNCGVNLTLGLPYVRTSPLHGTAFDIAGENIADPNSMLAAINLAIACTKNKNRKH